jgi:hypothetical protein
VRLGPLIALLAAALPTASLAVEQDALLWASVTANGALGGGVLFTGDTQARIGSGPQDFRQYVIRAGLGARIAHHVTVHGGYALFRTGSDRRLSTEHRTWQQIGFPVWSRRGLAVVGRTRLEQRFLDGADRVSWRVRQQVRANVPLGRPTEPSLVFASEGFLNLNGPRGAPRAGLDRWRVQAGLSVPLGGGVSLEPAYLNQYVPRRGRDLDEHILATGLSFRW